MIVQALLLINIISHVAVSADDCSISRFTRKRCKVNNAIMDSAACLEAGCCYDAAPETPATGRCYVKGNAIRWGGRLNFQPSAAPPRRRGQSSIMTVGGEPGFPGSEFTLQCNPSAPCTSGVTRYVCLRQGCCWRSGNCYQQKYIIMRMRTKCPDGFSDPPACSVIDPCENNPCNNGGVCAFTGPGKFSCSCKGGFSGLTCAANCKRTELAAVVKGKVIPDQSEYEQGKQVILACSSATTLQSSAVVSRQCLNGQFSPPLSTHPFICSSDCVVEKVAGTLVTSTLATSVHHGVVVTYACTSGSTSAGTNVLKRQCTDGKLLPELTINLIRCNSDCTVTKVDNAKSDRNAGVSIQHGEEVAYSCEEKFSTPPSTTFTRTCENGRLTPSLTTNKIVCSADCVVTSPHFSTATPNTASVKHGSAVEYKCEETHTGSSTSTTRQCVNGEMKPDFITQPYICSENCKLIQIANAETMPAVLVHGGDIDLKCLPTHTSITSAVASRKCIKGKLLPSLNDQKFPCFKTCNVVGVKDTTSVPSKDSPLVHLDTVTYTCVDKHTNQPGATMTRTCKDGSLEPPLASSKIICSTQCKVISGGEHTHASVVISTMIDHNSIITYTCNFHTHSPSSTSTLSRTCKNGVLTPRLDTDKIECFPYCLTPEVLKDGSHTPVKHAYPTGSVITYSCDSKFTHKTGDELVRTCGQDGTFSPTFSEKSIICSSDCTTPTVVVGAHVVTSGTIHNTQQVQYACDNHYTQQTTSVMTRTCTNGAVLPNPNDPNNAIKCYAPCEGVTVPSNSKIDVIHRPFLHEDTLVFSCDEKYTPQVGAIHQRKCMDGKLVPDLATKPYICRKDCDPPISVSTAIFAASASGQYHHGHKIKYVCNGDSTTSDTTERECTNGEFLPSLSTHGITCFKGCTPETLVRGSYLPRYSPGIRHKHLEDIVYTCDQQSRHLPTEETKRTCTNGVFQPTFVDKSISCRRDCKLDGVIADSTHNKGSVTLIKHGDEVVFECGTGFSNPTSASTKRTCVDGVLQPKMDTFSCYADCQAPDAVANGEFTPKTAVKHMESINFACNEDKYTSLSSASLTRTCKNGKYEPDLKTDQLKCYHNCIPEKLVNGGYKPTKVKYAHTTIIQYECNNKFSTTADVKRTCNDGSFEPTFAKKPLSCRPYCAVPDRLNAKTSVTGTMIASGTSVKYTCNDKYSPGMGGSPMTRACNEGKLEPAMSGATDVVCYPSCDKPIPKSTQTISPTTTDNFYKHGAQLTYTCASTYSLPRTVSDNKKKCENGNLLPAIDLVCHQDCNKPSTLTHGSYTAKYGTYLEGDKVEYKCDEEFSHPSNAQTVLTCTGGTYSPTFAASNLQCNQDCKTLPVVGNSDIAPVQSRYIHGTTITINCERDYTLIGEKVLRTCEAGTYKPDLSTKSAECKKKCKVEKIENGFTASGSNTLAVNTLVEHAISVNFKCNPGWTALNAAVVSRTCTNGDFDPKEADKDFTCYQLKSYQNCKPTSPGGGKIKGGKTEFQHLEQFEFECEPQHTMVGVAKRTCQNGQLAPSTDLFCKKQCKVPGLTNGKSLNFAKDVFVDHNTEVSFQCNPSFSTPHATKRNCEDGSFKPKIDDSANPLKCYGDCGVKTITNTEPLSSTVRHLTEVAYVCVSKHTMDAGSEATRTCRDGKLDPPRESKPVKCWKQCLSAFPRVQLATTEPLTAPLNHLQTVKYTCDAKHQNNKNLIMTRTCKDGKLDPPIDNSNPIVCYLKCDVPEINHAKTSVTTDHIITGEKVIYTCESTHSPSIPGAAMVRTCSDGTLYPKFSDAPLACKAKCEVKTVLLSTPVIGIGHIIPHGITTHYTCDQHYTSAIGQQKVLATCDDGTINIQVCHKQCVVPTLTKGKAVPAVGQRFNHGQLVEFSCNEKYHTLDITSRTCKDGELTPAIDAAYPLTCHPDCKALPVVGNSDIIPVQSRYKHGDTITINCESGYYLIGEKVLRTCVAGSFKPDLSTKSAECKKKCIVEKIENGFTESGGNTLAVNNLVEHKISVDFKCNPGWTALNTAVVSRTCTNGDFDPKEADKDFTCYQDCGVKTITNTEPLSSTVPHLTEVAYVCVSKYTMDAGSKATRTCRHGNLDPPRQFKPVKCLKPCTLQSVAFSSSLPTSLSTHGQNAVYTCDQNHVTTSGQKTFTIGCNDGALTAALQVCHQPCTLPSVASSSSLPTSLLTHGQHAVYTCDQNHVTTSGQKTFTIGCNDGALTAALQVCHQQCQVPDQLNVKTTGNVAKLSYVNHLTTVTFQCDLLHTSKHSMGRTCQEGTFLPKIDDTNDPLKCYADCTVKTIADTQPQAKSTVHHLTAITYACVSSTHTMDPTSEATRTCKSGVFDPPFETKPVICWLKCKVEEIENGYTEAGGKTLAVDALVEHGITVYWNCNPDYSIPTIWVSARKCVNGEFNPKTSDKSFYCYNNCKVTPPNFGSIKGGTVKSGKHEFKQMRRVDFECITMHVMVGAAERYCQNGLLSPTGTTVCKRPCTVRSVANSANNAGGKSTIMHNTDVVYTCTGGYLAIRSQTQQFTSKCVDGAMGLEECHKGEFKCKTAVDRNIACPSNQFIFITSAFFGRKSKTECASLNLPHNRVPTSGCSLATALTRAQQVCDDKATCILEGGEWFWGGNPCDDGGIWVNKYVIVTWVCKSKTKCTVPSLPNVGSSATANSKVNHDIEVTFNCIGDYYCPGTMTRKCYYGDFRPAIDDPNDPLKCNKKMPGNECTPESVSDTKPSTKKLHHQEVFTYECKSTHTMSAASEPRRTCNNGVMEPSKSTKPVVCESGRTACKDETLNLKCDSNMVITIISSFYGRRDTTTCPSFRAKQNIVPQNGCSAEKALKRTKRKCNTLAQCNITPEGVKKFGRPCTENVHKYLTVEFSCGTP